MLKRPELIARGYQAETHTFAAKPKSVFLVEIGSEKYGLPIDCVRSVLKVKEIFPVPLAPPHFIGLMNLRGRVVAVVDLRMCLGKPPNGQHFEQLAVGVEIDGEEYALTVDNVGEVIELDANDSIAFHAPEAVNAKSWMAGVFNTPRGIVTVLALADVMRINDPIVEQPVSGVHA